MARRAKKKITQEEKRFAEYIVDSGKGPIYAARDVLGWDCATKTEQQAAKDLARTQRVVEYSNEYRAKITKLSEAREALDSVTTLNTDKFRKYCIRSLEEIRDNRMKPAITRIRAMNALEKLVDPAEDTNLINKWLDILWRYAEAHCPSCHKNFPLWKVYNEQLALWRKENSAKAVVPAESALSRRTEGLTFADRRKTPHSGQQRFLGAPERHLVGLGAARAGKVLGGDTPIFTTKGWKKYKDLTLQDQLFDEKGNSCNIVGFAPECNTGNWYKIIFDTGEEVIAHENHEWITHDYNYRAALRRRKGTNRINRRTLKPLLIETKGIKDTLFARKKHSNHAIKIPSALELPTQELLIDPYTLGIWLGDGTAVDDSITTNDSELFEYIPYSVTKWKSQYVYRIHDIRNKLQQLNLKNNKHIPEIYFRGSKEQRLNLVRGLMDSDGYIDSRGRCSFYNTNIKIIEGMEFLLRSLGIKVSRTSKIPTFNGKKYKRCFILNFTTKLKVFNLKRKLQRLPTKISIRNTYNYIVDVIPVERQIGRCIEVDSPSSLYLCGSSLIPTHNSWFMASLAFLAIMLPGIEIWIIARVYEDARSEQDYLVSFLRTALYPFFDNMVTMYEDKRSSEIVLLTKWGSDLRIRSAKSKGSITGRALEVALLAEPGWIPADTYEEVRARMSERLGRILAFGTPKGEEGILGRLVKMQGRDPVTGKVIRRTPQERLISAGSPWNVSMLLANLDPSDNPEYVSAELNAARQELTDLEYASEFLGEIRVAEGVKFPMIKDRHLRDIPPTFYQDAVYCVGIDQGPKNFGVHLLAYDGKIMVSAWEWFDDSLDTMKTNLKKVREMVPDWIRRLGGNPADWLLTMHDRLPSIDGIFVELMDEDLEWPTPIVIPPINIRKYNENWRRETCEWVNNLASAEKVLFDLQHTDELFHQIQVAVNVPMAIDKDQPSDASKGWKIDDPWRGDHICDAWLFTIYTVMSGQLIKPDVPNSPEDPLTEHKRAWDYQRKVDELRELKGFVDSPYQNSSEVFKEVFKRERYAGKYRALTSQSGYYDNES